MTFIAVRANEMTHTQFFMHQDAQLRMSFILLSRPLIKPLSSVGPSINPWGMPQANSHQLNFVSLFTILWLRWSSEFSAQLMIHLSGAHITTVATRVLWETVSKAFLDSSSLFYPYSHCLSSQLSWFCHVPTFSICKIGSLPLHLIWLD